MRDIRILLIFLLALGQLNALNAQTFLTGNVSDKETKEELIGASIKISQGNAFVKGGVTNIDGEFRVQINPGIYDVEVSYTGYTTQKTSGVTVLENQINILNFKLETSTTNLNENVVIIRQYKVPLIQKDMTSSGQVITYGFSTGGTYSPSKKERKAQKKEELMRGLPSVATNTILEKKPIDSLPPEQEMHEQYNEIQENPFLKAFSTPFSTFSIDVDVASYANTRRFLTEGYLPPADAVRIEEMVNYFDYRYPQPKSGQPFEVITELGKCPWQPQHQLLMVALQGLEIDLGQLPPSNFVFLVDVSGSMGDENKLPLVQKSLEMLLEHLRPEDRVAIVTYAGNEGLALPSTPVKDRESIRAAILKMSSGGSTAGGAGIKLAYKIARENFRTNGNNRIILCTDGDFNVGVSNEKDLVQLIEKERESGVYLTVLGFGTGNYQDGKMQSLADAGNGNHAYIDGIKEAQKVLVKEMGGTLFTIAKDVKLQLEFNPALVESYRLIGYENRMLEKEDFDNDKKDAGELGSGHRVTALYEIVPKVNNMPSEPKINRPPTVSTDSTVSIFKADELMVLKLRYKRPKGDAVSLLIQKTVSLDNLGQTGENFQLASTVAAFGMLLRDSPNKGNATWEKVRNWAEQATKTEDPNGYRKELVKLIKKAKKADFLNRKTKY